MAAPVVMPRQGQSVESCVITKWNKKIGDPVAKGDLLFSYETDKASFEEYAKEDGIILDIYFQEGDDVPVLKNMCLIGQDGETAPQPVADKTMSAEHQADSSVSAPSPTIEIAKEIFPGFPNTAGLSHTEAPSQNSDGRIKISPRARSLAERTGIDPRYIIGSGANERIIENDVLESQAKGQVLTASAIAHAFSGDLGAIPSGTGLAGRITTGDLARISAIPAVSESAANIPSGIDPSVSAAAGAGSDSAVAAASSPEYIEEKIPNIRKVIAKTMITSLSTMAQLTLNSSFDATELMAFRQKVKTSKEQLGLENITLNDMIVFAVSRTLLNHRSVNANLIDDKMLFFTHANVGVAVDTDRGLMVPVLYHADTLSLNEISRQTGKLIADTRSGSISPDLFKGGSFTVTNLGALGIETFTPVINPPQTCILGVNTITERVREVNGVLKVYSSMSLSLTFDHRALDGAPAARFLKELSNNLEHFSIMLAR